VGLFVKILRVRPSILAPVTVLITLIGVYTVNNRVFDIVLVIVFGALGYLMKKLGFEPGPRWCWRSSSARCWRTPCAAPC
jgi:putative tricarboxylic transport membrane protein